METFVCWPWSIKGHTQTQITSADLFFFFHAPKSFIKLFKFLLYKTNRWYFSVCVYRNKSQKTSQRVKNNSHATRLRLVSNFSVFLHAVTSSVIYYGTRARTNVISLLNKELSIMSGSKLTITHGVWLYSLRRLTRLDTNLSERQEKYLIICKV